MYVHEPKCCFVLNYAPLPYSTFPERAASFRLKLFAVEADIVAYIYCRKLDCIKTIFVSVRESQ